MLKRILFALLMVAGVTRVVAYLNRRTVPILCYHSITRDETAISDDLHKLHTPLSRFVQHLDHIQHRYRVISLNEYLLAHREHRPLPDYSVVLMFDDGFEDFYSVAAPELVRRGLPAVVFVITEWVEDGLPRNGDNFLSWREIEDLAAKGIQIGSHTCSHQRLSDGPLEQVKGELAGSRMAIFNHVGQHDVALSYPFGEATPSVAKLAELTGYSCGITGRLGPNDQSSNVFLLNRTSIASDDDRFTFAARAAGLTWWVGELRRMFLQKNDPASDTMAQVEVGMLPETARAKLSASP